VKYRFIREQTGLCRVGKVCRVDAVSRPDYDAWLNRTPGRPKSKMKRGKSGSYRFISRVETSTLTRNRRKGMIESRILRI